MKVNTTGKVANLNADQLDGLDSTVVGREMWAVVGAADGNLVRGRRAYSELDLTRKVGTGHYVVAFFDPVNNCAYTATTTNGNAGQTGVKLGTFVNWVEVFTVSSNGTPADMAFHLIVTC